MFHIKNMKKHFEQEIRSVELGVCSMQLFHFDHVTFIQFKLCCCVQNFIEIGWFFAEIWRYIDFQYGSRPSSWNCFTTIRDHPRSLCCWPQLPVKFHVNLIHRSEAIAIWIFRIFGLKCLFRPPKWGFWGLWTPKCDYSSSRPPKNTSLRKSESFKLSTVKICWGVWPVGELTESVTDTQTYTQTHSIGQTIMPTTTFTLDSCFSGLSKCNWLTNTTPSSVLTTNKWNYTFHAYWI